MPKDDTQPILEVETNLPPMIHDQTPPTAGSAAPNDDLIMPAIVTTTTQKKKFAGGKIIATILGLFLLVGGIGAGVYLVGQNQDIREKAGSCAANPCGPGLRCDGNGGCIPRDTPEGEEGNVESVDPPKDPWKEEDGGVPTIPSNQTSCTSDGGFWCAGCGGFCLDGSYQNGGCIQAQLDRCGETAQIASGVGSLYGSEIWLCKVQPPNGASCDGNHGGVLRNDLNKDSCFCGVLQVDTPTGFTSYKNNCGCGGNDEEPATVSSVDTPTAPPSITAQCQNIKAYSPTWALLTNAQLSVLTTGSQVNFCVAGVASAETFDRARLTINGVLQAETTTIRPSSTDFCQLYTIPAGTTTFNVTAQIHHLTLGWK